MGLSTIDKSFEFVSTSNVCLYNRTLRWFLLKIYCTICSAKKKDECGEFPELKFPAIELYKSKRIKKIYDLSLEDKIEFRILSG